jgi:hypothetical protein
MMPVPELSPPEEVRRALSRLVSGGPESIWLPEVQPLLELPTVKERLEAGEDADEALRQVLLDAIEGLGQSQYRNLLEIVLGLTPDSESLSAGERRALAGKRFRGGQRPVTAGTIRQHHERRALTELTKRLLASTRSATARPQAQEWTEWHPAVRESWAEQGLSLWRISVADYDSAEIEEILGPLMRKHKVAAWSVYEMFGIFDFLLEAWLPLTAHAHRFSRELESAYGERLVRCDAFAAEEVVTHWAWRGEGREMRRPAPAILANPPPPQQLERIGAGDGRPFAEMMKSEVAARVAAEPGIGILVSISGLWGYPLLSVAERELVKDLILGVVEEGAGILFQTVLLRGSGFGDYLLQGKIKPDDFYELKTKLVGPLDRALRPRGLRAHSFVLAGAAPLIREERLTWKTASDGRPSVEELLREGESVALEVRSSAFVDLLPDDRIGSKWADSEAGKGLLKTVTGMLNSKGGTILLGACPVARAEGDPRFSEKRLKGSTVVGDYLVIGIDDEIVSGSDSYLRKVANVCRKLIEPDPLVHLEFSLERLEGKTLLQVSVPSIPDEWFYFVADRENPQFWVRNSVGLSERYSGRDADIFKNQFPRA